MTISINRDRCEGYGMCAQAAPDLIELDDDGDPQITDPELLRADLDKAQSAARACPVAAVNLATSPSTSAK
ncbi:ferredoxin [Rhodococcus sp. T2V]|uniref:ferredoxin n=1 Tax=Rhodococcus sp. T2V TaxID=3034164 RepID=UPI0023E283AE|nr:ferredoxin [Rhodococcus sp. T2V]MDF3311089.1 ferredoxin [Rhodococcus sp. T2V]